MSRIEPQPGIMEIALYQGGASHVPGMSRVLKLSSNENPFGTPESARDAIRASADSINRYPPTDHAALRDAIAGVHGLDADRVICGAGSDEVIHWLCQAYAGPGTEVMHTAHGFAMYKISARAAGAEPVEVPERERTVDVDALLERASDRTRLVFVTNPGNPTGTMIDADEIARLADGLPEQCLLVLDGAYAEFAEGYDGGAALIEARDNVVMTRTFSKIYGLGGLRVGWGYGPAHVIDVLNRIRGPFNLSCTALAAAEAAVQDREWVAYCYMECVKQRAWLEKQLLGLGIAVDPSRANYVLARFEDAEEADACEAHLRGQGILVRRVAGYGFPEGLRITVGTEEDCRRVVEEVARFREAR